MATNLHVFHGRILIVVKYKDEILDWYRILLMFMMILYWWVTIFYLIDLGILEDVFATKISNNKLVISDFGSYAWEARKEKNISYEKYLHWTKNITVLLNMMFYSVGRIFRYALCLSSLQISESILQIFSQKSQKFYNKQLKKFMHIFFYLDDQEYDC